MTWLIGLMEDKLLDFFSTNFIKLINCKKRNKKSGRLALLDVLKLSFRV